MAPLDLPSSRLPAERSAPLPGREAARRRRRVPAADVVAVAVLAALAVAAFGLPAAFGKPVLPGDDFTQNYPLRELAGQLIRSGHLPLFNPWIWSGTPLLAGWNAAAAYPLTWLFAVMPDMAAWSIGLALTYAVAAGGMYGFVRAGLRLRPVPSFLAGLTFGLGGAMTAQVPHFGLVAGMSWVPLALLAVTRLTEPDRGGRSLLQWAGFLAVTVGLVVLAGEPRAIADAIVILGLYAAWRVAGLGRAWWRPALWVAGGAALGLALSAVQILPGLAAIDSSQRASSAFSPYYLYSSGSLPTRWLTLLLVPDLLGGSGTGSQPLFFGSYNLTEVTCYAGVLPLVAAFGLLARLRLRRPVPPWLVWHVIAVVGVLLALGGSTPLGHLLVHVPFFGTQRLQSRNIIITDLALAVLAAYWAQDPFPARRTAGLRWPGWRALAEPALAALPAVGVLAIVLPALAGDDAIFRWALESNGLDPAVLASLRPWLIPSAVFGAAALALVLAGRQLPRRALAVSMTALVVTDVLAFTALAVVQVAHQQPASPAPAAASGSTATSDAAVPHLSIRPVQELGFAGRFAIYDPDLLDPSELATLSPPDLNSVTGTASVQGYTSIVDGNYAAATGSHKADGEGQNTLSPAAVSNGTLDALDTSVLLTLPQYATGALRSELVAPHWTLAGFDGSFEIWRNSRPQPPLTLQPLAGRSDAGATVTALSGPAVSPDSARVTSPAGVEVVRSAAAIPGWTATWQPSGGAATPLPVRADGIVQAVDVPAGTGIVRWHYAQPRLQPGLALSVAAALVILATWLVPDSVLAPVAALARRRAARAAARSAM